MTRPSTDAELKDARRWDYARRKMELILDYPDPPIPPLELMRLRSLCAYAHAIATGAVDSAESLKANPPQVLPPVSVADPSRLKTAREACARIGCSLKTLRAHVRSGALRYVLTGHGKIRQIRKFTDLDLDDFVKKQTRTDIPRCQFSKTRARLITASTSNIAEIAFSARPKPPPGGKRKR